MNFKSQIETHWFAFDSKDHLSSTMFQTLNEKFKFAKTHVIFNKKQQEKYSDRLKLNPFETAFNHETSYLLKPVENKGKIFYNIEVDKFTVKLKLNWINRQKLKWVHSLCWIQNPESNWLKQSLLAGLISILTYFVGQNIGFNKGYQNGLKESIKVNQQVKSVFNK